MQSVLKKMLFGRTNWRMLKNSNPEEAEINSKIKLRQIHEEQKLVESHLLEDKQHLNEVQELESSRISKKIFLLFWVPIFMGVLILGFLSSLWGLEAFITLGIFKRIGIALTLIVLSLIGGWAIGCALRMPSDIPHRKLTFGIGLTILILAILCTATINTVRGFDITLLEKSHQLSSNGNDLVIPEGQEPVSTSSNFLNILFVLASLIMGIAGEIGAAYAFDQLLNILIPVWTLSRLRGRVHHWENKLAQLAVAEEEALRLPERVQAMKGRNESLIPLAKQILITIGLAIAILIVLLLLFIPRAAHSFPLSQTVLCVDLSTSASSDGEFSKNLISLEGFLQRFTQIGQRIIVFGINEKSFQTPPLLSSTGPIQAGRYGEELLGWRRALLTEWHHIKPRLSPTARGSDIFGAISRSALEFNEAKATRKFLILFSDMRQAAQGFNFEQPLGDPRRLIEEVSHQGLIPSLKEVQIWVLGANTAGVDQKHWANLKAFWVEFFRRAEARLVTFSPNRRWEP